jgi:hypothetical protein
VVLRQTALRAMLDRQPEAAEAMTAPGVAGPASEPLSSAGRWTERRHA